MRRDQTGSGGSWAAAPDDSFGDRVSGPVATPAKPYLADPVLIAGSAPGAADPLLIAGVVPGKVPDPVLVAGEAPRPPGEPVTGAPEVGAARTVLPIGQRSAEAAPAAAVPVERPDPPAGGPLALWPSTTGVGDPVAAPPAGGPLALWPSTTGVGDPVSAPAAGSRSGTATRASSRPATAPSPEQAVTGWPDRPARTRPAADDHVDPHRRHEPSVASPIVAFISGSGGTGVTTTATGAGLALATMRPTALIDIGAGHASVARRAVEPGARLADVARDPRLAMRSGPAGGLQTIDGSDRWSADPGVVRSALLALTRIRTTALLDVGNDTSAAAGAGLAAADRFVLVTGLSQVALDAAAATVERLSRTAPASAKNLVVAVVLTRRQRAARVERHLRRQLPGRAGTWVVVPYDRAATRDGPLDPLRLRSRTRAAYDALAGLLR
ncbi:hypothetical protein [Dactylosporangium sp. CA-092794]|uniref:MinD/ParA family ATP-binding protein n=1 Tax=Dactylosporangium sp. CA-092794 TaxID=3239929 RepID=UPI003D8AD63D